MTTRFKLEHTFSDIPIELFEEHLNHPELIDLLDAMPAFRSRELVGREDLDDGKIKWRFRVVAGGEIPPAAAKVLNEDMLTWWEDTIFSPSEHCIYWSIEPVKMKDKLVCKGTWKLNARAGGTHRVIDGELTVKIPILGKVVESFLVSELKRNYDVEPDIQRKFYQKMAAQQ